MENENEREGAREKEHKPTRKKFVQMLMKICCQGVKQYHTDAENIDTFKWDVLKRVKGFETCVMCMYVLISLSDDISRTDITFNTSDFFILFNSVYASYAVYVPGQ